MRRGDERYARLAIGLLSRLWPARPTATLADRTAAVTAIEAALENRARLGRRRVFAVGLTAAVAAGAAAILTASWSGGGSRHNPAASPTHAQPGAGPSSEPLRPGDQIAARNDELSLDLGSGSRLTFSHGARADVVETGRVQWFHLRTGQLRADVAPLEPDQRFVISTADAEVEVGGTSFDVTITDGAGPCADAGKTRVRVHHGRVTVRTDGGRRQHDLTTGELWPTCSPSAATARFAPPSAAETATTLARENALFAAAISARRRGDARAAARQLRELLARFPQSQLAEAARQEQRRLEVDGAGGP